MELSINAKKDLRKILEKETECFSKGNDFSDEEINQIGLFLLTILAEKLKIVDPELLTEK